MKTNTCKTCGMQWLCSCDITHDICAPCLIINMMFGEDIILPEQRTQIREEVEQQFETAHRRAVMN